MSSELVLSDEVQLTEVELLFRTNERVVSLHPKMSHSVLSPDTGDNVLGLFVETQDDDGHTSLDVTGITASYIVTPTAICSNIASTSDLLTIHVDDVSVMGNLTGNALFSHDTTSFYDIGSSQCPSKLQLMDGFYDKTHVDTNVVTKSEFETLATLYNLPNVSATNSLIQTAVSGGVFDHTEFVMSSNIANVIDVFELNNTTETTAMIASAFDNYDFTAFVTLNNLFNKIAEYNTIAGIANVDIVGQLIQDSITGNTGSPGFASTLYVDNEVSTLSTMISSSFADYMPTSNINAEYATIVYVNDQLALLGDLNSNVDGASVTQIIQNKNSIAALAEVTYTRTEVNENFVSTNNAYVTAENVIGLIETHGNAGGSGSVDDDRVNSLIDTALNDAATGYTTHTLTPQINSLQINVSNEISSRLALSLADYASVLLLESRFNTYTTNVLDPRIEDFVSAVDVDLHVNASLNSYTTNILENRLDGFLTTTEVNDLVDTALNTYTTSRLPNEVSSLNYINENDLATYLGVNEYQTETSVSSAILSFQTNTLPTLGYVNATDMSVALNEYTTTTLQTQLDATMTSYVSSTELATRNFVTFSEMTAHVSGSIVNKVNADTMTNSIGSALNTYTNTVLDARLNGLDVSSQVASYISLDTSQVLLSKINSYLYNSQLSTGLTSVLSQMSYMTESDMNARIASLQLVSQPSLETNYYTKNELFLDTNAMIPTWLSQNRYTTETYVDAEIAEKIATSFQTTQVYILEQLQDFEGGGGSSNITEPYLQMNYLSRNDWLQWVNTSALTSSDVQNLINVTFDSLSSDFDDLTNQSNVLSQQMTTLQDELTQVTANVASHGVGHTLLNTRLDALESNVTTDVWATITALHVEDANLMSQLSLLVDEIESTNANVTDQSETLTSLIHNTSSSLEGNLANIQIDLENLIATSANIELLSGHFVSLSSYEQHLSNCDDDCGVPIVNLYQYNLNQSIIRVDLTNNDDDTFVYDAGTFRFNHPFCTVDGQAVNTGQTLLIRNLGTLNGVYTVVSIDLANVVTCSQVNTLVTNQLISVTSVDQPSGTKMNGSNFVVSVPTTDFIQLTFTNYGTMGYQNASNVAISGGVIEADRLAVDSINTQDTNSIVIRLPDASTNSNFQVTATNLENDRNDVVFQVDGEGTVVCRAFHTSSDASLKTNVATIAYPISLVRLLQGKTFDWLDESKNTNGPSYGFIAQEVEEHFPSLVTTTLNNKLAVDYPKIVSILVEAVKDLYQHAQDAGLTNGTTYTSVMNGTHVAQSTHTCQTDITKNLVGIGNPSAQSFVVQLASTREDIVSIVPIPDTANFTLATNGGVNTLDGVAIRPGMGVLIKDCPNTAYNGVYDVNSVTENIQGLFSICTRKFDSQMEIQGAIVFVQSDRLYEYQGETNDTRSFVCVEPNDNTASFLIDTSPIAFTSLSNDLKSMAFQDKESVNIQGGSISVDHLSVSEIHATEPNFVINLPSNTTNETFSIHNGTETVFSVDGTGLAVARDFYQPSDSRLKKNVNSIENALNAIQNLRGVTFDWIDRQSVHPQYGFIAQEVRVHFPSLVHQQIDGKLAVDYSKVVALLVESVKDLANMLNV